MGKSISGVAEVDLPWVKLNHQGVEAISDQGLLAILLRNGYGGQNVLEVSTCILDKFPPDKLIAMDVGAMRKIKGITPGKAEILAAAFELTRRGLKQVGIAPSITRPADAIPFIADLRDKKKEHFVALFLNARGQLIRREDVSVGSLNASLVHPREVFGPAVGSCAASVILAHNHPSGVRL